MGWIQIWHIHAAGWGGAPIPLTRICIVGKREPHVIRKLSKEKHVRYAA
ncbi:hypothetical protein QFZ94_008792 [Paraburkholderia sp. JPY465]